MEVNSDNNEASASKGLGIPPGGEVVLPSTLRTAVDEEGNGVGDSSLVANGLDDPAMNAVIQGTSEPELLRDAGDDVLLFFPPNEQAAREKSGCANKQTKKVF